MDVEYQLDVDLQKICRCCLTVDQENLKNFFCSDILDGAIVAFPKIYENVTDIRAERDDKLPNGICTGCKTKIGEFYSFKQKCINSNELLCKILEIPIMQTKRIRVEETKKPFEEEKSNESTNYELQTENIQTVEEPNGEDFIELIETNDNEKPLVNVVQMSVFKYEEEQDPIEIDDTAISEVLDYECSEYLSQTDMYGTGDNCSTVDDADYPPVDKIVYKIEADENSNCEQLEILDLTETYDVVTMRESSSKMGSKKPSKRPSKKKIDSCNICKIVLKSSVINAHRDLHQQTLPIILDSIPYFRCGRCKTVFPEIGLTECHLLNGSCSPNNEETSCTDYQYLEEFTECDTEEEGPFSGCRTLRLSSIVPLSDNSFLCEMCNDFSSSNIHEILMHCVSDHFDNDDKNNVVYYDEFLPGSHRCGVCQLNQPSLSAALRHAFFHLSTYLCPIRDCNDQFAEFRLLSLHVEQNHFTKDNVTTHRCMHCGVISPNYQAFRQHQRKECEKKVFRCNVCEKKFFYKSSLSMHMKYHETNARFGCEVCQKKFSQLCDYKVHFRIHSGEKPYKCEFCDKSFRSISNRKDHMSTHRTDKLFLCEICHQTFKSERTLRGHYPIHNPTKKFSCKECNKKFHRKFHLKLHAKSHDKKEYRVVSTSSVSIKT